RLDKRQANPDWRRRRPLRWRQRRLGYCYSRRSDAHSAMHSAAYSDGHMGARVAGRPEVPLPPSQVCARAHSVTASRRLSWAVRRSARTSPHWLWKEETTKQSSHAVRHGDLLLVGVGGAVCRDERPSPEVTATTRKPTARFPSRSRFRPRLRPSRLPLTQGLHPAGHDRDAICAKCFV